MIFSSFAEVGFIYKPESFINTASCLFHQEREFCEGASTLCRALRVNSLRGVVAQTHASSPRCSAYLAAQLRELAAVLKAKAPAAPATPELGKLVVFGAGDKYDRNFLMCLIINSLCDFLYVIFLRCLPLRIFVRFSTLMTL